MNIWIFISIVYASAHLLWAAPTDPHLQAFEQSMLDKLHKPWFKPDKRQEFPRKGEYKCKGGVCKTKVNEGCEDCQFPVPLEFEWKTG